MAPSSKVVRVRVVEVEYSPGGTENGMVDTAGAAEDAAEDEVEAAEADEAEEAAEEADEATDEAEEAAEEAEAATEEATEELVESAEATLEATEEGAALSIETKVEAASELVCSATAEDSVSLELSATLLEDGKAEAGANVSGPEETGLDTGLDTAGLDTTGLDTTGLDTGLDTTELDELSTEVGASVAGTGVSRDSTGELATIGEVTEVACPTDVGVPVATLKTVRPVT